MGEFAYPPVNFETHPSRYVHWDLDIDGSPTSVSKMMAAADVNKDGQISKAEFVKVMSDPIQNALK